MAFIIEYSGTPRTILRTVNDFGFESYDLVSPPRRLLGPTSTIPLLENNIDKRRTMLVPTTTSLFDALPEGDNWLSMASRTVARLYAAYLIAEDPQRRLDVHKAATLMHQVSLVQHILSDPKLNKVMIGDEVGLGKTIEAGLLIRRLLDQNSALKVLYLAPARLVSNVVNELRHKLDLDARKWSAGNTGDARLESDRIVVASIHKAVFGDNPKFVIDGGPWDVIFVDECHHLSDWGINGGKPNQSFKLVQQLVNSQPSDGRLFLMSGTPHQGSEARFKNLLRLLADDGQSLKSVAGKVIYRTKDRVRDWRGQPLFPSRQINPPTIVQLGMAYEHWYEGICSLYDQPVNFGSRSRATGWAKGQALQWAASSVQAGLGFLVRLSMRRLGWNPDNNVFTEAISALRPYRGGLADEPISSLYARLVKQVGLQKEEDDQVCDLEELDDERWTPDPVVLAELLNEGVSLLSSEAADAKWEALCKIIEKADNEKIVFFAQPVETVGVVASFLKKRFGVDPAIIIGNQSDEERLTQVREFQSIDGPRFLVSSRAGGEGLNMQRARRLVHLDVPWNPMDLEQRVGRVHRFGSRKTIIVDTIVVAGSREVDMYRIAREKLALISSQLDPEQFEILFSRVMSLVPPKELEEVIGCAPPGPLGLSESNAIGNLVTEGFKTWSVFDDTYRHEAEKIRAIEPGNATWSDLAGFLSKYGDAAATEDVELDTFEFKDDEIIAVAEKLPALVVGSKTYVCGDTGGLPIDMADGKPVHALGLNLPEITEALTNRFIPDKVSGCAFLRIDQEILSILEGNSVVGLLVFLRQTIHCELGNSREIDLSFNSFALLSNGEKLKLTSNQQAKMMRAIFRAQRSKEPAKDNVLQLLKDYEATQILELKIPSDQEISMGIRHAVWPIAALAFI
jgi:SNF2 family DNA or RNA helicase